MPKKSKIDHWLSRLDTWMWEAENSRDSAPHKTLWHITRILFAVVRDVFAGNITLHAMGLVYKTLLSIVPFLALSFSVLKGLGVHNQLEPILQTWSEPLGDQGTELVDNVVQFVDNFNVGVLSSVGLGLLIYTVISLVQKVEQSFNEIWRVSQLRSIGQRFSNYLSVIIIGPVLVFSALGVTATVIGSDVVSSILTIKPFGWLYSLASKIVPYFMIIGLFTFLYAFIPNTKIKIRYAFLGAIVGGILWQTTGVAFAKFFAASASSGSYAAIYSGFAVGFISLWWLYISWLILLVGASISFYAQHTNQITRSRIYLPSAIDDEHTGLAMVYRVANHFDQQGGGLKVSEVESSLAMNGQAIERIRNKLIKNDILLIAGDDADQLIPAKPLDKILMINVMNALRATENPTSEAKENSAVSDISSIIDDAQEKALDNQTISDWIRSNKRLSK
ncbi:MAG: YihY/virulence factor BrkB family protein [Cellvibrionaceae bacterium]